jgi:hypothetical protein
MLRQRIKLIDFVSVSLSLSIKLKFLYINLTFIKIINWKRLIK